VRTPIVISLNLAKPGTSKARADARTDSAIGTRWRLRQNRVVIVELMAASRAVYMKSTSSHTRNCLEQADELMLPEQRVILNCSLWGPPCGRSRGALFATIAMNRNAPPVKSVV